MAIAATSGVTSSTATSATDTSTTGSTNAAAGPNSLDYNSFLQLLIAQMKNQDPTKPADPSQFIAQLASFSNVEQAIKTNSKLDSMMTSLALTQADGFIGHTVTSADGTVREGDGRAHRLRRRRGDAGQTARKLRSTPA